MNASKNCTRTQPVHQKSAIGETWILDFVKSKQARAEDTPTFTQLARDFEQSLSVAQQRQVMSWRAQWKERAVGFRTTSLEYQRKQELMLPFLVAGPATSQTFLTVAKTACLRYSTMETYWTTLLAAAKSVNIPAPLDAAKICTWLQRNAETIEQPQRETATPLDVEAWCKAIKSERLADCMRLTFYLGQRLADVVRLQRRSLVNRDTHVAVIFYQGKVVPKIGPFSINVHVEDPHNIPILVRAAQRCKNDSDYLFGDPDETKAEIAAVMTKDTRSLRRGGLTILAQTGASVDQLLYLSKHTNEPMLRKYLDHGSYLSNHADMTLQLMVAAHGSSARFDVRPS